MDTQRDLWILRVYYFVVIGGAGFLFPFVNIFFTQRGLTGTEIGVLATCSSVAALIAAPWWGRRNDRSRHPRCLIQFGLLATALLNLLLGLQTLFVGMMLIVVADALLSAGVSPASDALVVSLTRGKVAGFGSVRLWGSLGWAVTAFVAGGLIERTGLFTMFGGYALSAFISIALLAMLQVGSRDNAESIDAARPPERLATRALLSDRVLLALALTLAIVGFAANGYYQFEPVYMKQLGAGETIIGLASAIGALVELPAMLWADRLVKRVGPERLLRFSFVLDIGRWMAVLAAPTVPMILVGRLISGLSYSFYVVSLVEFCAGYAPQRYVTMALALFTVTLPSFIRVIAAPAGGWAYDAFGAYWLYAIAAAGTALGWLIMKMRVRAKPALFVNF